MSKERQCSWCHDSGHYARACVHRKVPISQRDYDLAIRRMSLDLPTLRELGKEFGISHQSVRTALAKVQRKLRARNLRLFLVGAPPVPHDLYRRQLEDEKKKDFPEVDCS